LWDFAEISGAPIVQAIPDGQDTLMLLAAELAPVGGVYLVPRQDVTELAHLRGGRIGVLSATGQRAINFHAFHIPATGLPPALATMRRQIHRHRGLVAREIVGR
jgi:hypothetical protein